jgi:hypothetical protein
MKTATVMLISTCTALAGQAPTADEIVGRMMERDQARQASLRAYNWTSHYVLDNKERHAEMTAVDPPSRYRRLHNYKSNPSGDRVGAFPDCLPGTCFAREPVCC